MNIQELRQSLKLKWLYYYKDNRHWMEKMQIWANFVGERRPLSSFVLATVTVLEPNLIDILPLLAELNSDPDAIIAALGLNFNPDNYLHLIEVENLEKSNLETEDLHQCHHLETIVNNSNIQSQSVTLNTTDNSFENTKPKLQIAVASSYLKKAHSQPKNTITNSTAYETQPAPLIAVATTIQGQGSMVKIIHDKIPNQVNQSPVLHPRNLSNWIDDFCQGKGIDKEEAVIIPF